MSMEHELYTNATGRSVRVCASAREEEVRRDERARERARVLDGIEMRDRQRERSRERSR